MDNEYFASINEVSKRLSVPAHTLRYWEKQFPVAIRPTTGAGGRRYYRTETVHRLEIIKDLLYNRGMTIAGVKKMLRDGMLADIASGADVGPRVQTESIAPSHGQSVDVSAAIALLESARALLTDK